MGEDLNRLTVSGGADGMSLLEFLAESFECSKRKAKNMLDARRVYVNRQRVWMAKHRLSAGDVIETAARSAGERRNPNDGLKVLARRKGLCIVDKPAGLLTQGARSVESLARESFGENALEAVHRLDRDTSGALILALCPKTRELLVELFRRHEVHKEYLAIVTGSFSRNRSTISKRIDGKSAATEVEVLQSGRDASLVRCVIHTGRTHQIRRHLESLGHPLAGDKQYGRGKVPNPILRSLPRQMLHASAIEFPDPSGAGVVAAKSPLPADFRNALKRLRLKN